MNTYVIYGTINYFIDEEVKKIIKDNQKITFDLECNTIEDLINEASFSNMFQDKKYIVVKNSKLFYPAKKDADSNKKAKEIDILYNYLNNENKDVYLIFVLDKKPDGKKKITKLLSDQNHIIEIKSMTKTESKNELKKYVINHKYNITDESLWYIINNSLNNFDICINEINKLFLYYNEPCFIEQKIVESLVSLNIKDNNYELIDSIMERKLDESIKNLRIIKLYKIDPIAIFMGITSEVRKTYLLLLARKKNYSYADILKLGILEFQIKKYDTYLNIYNENELKSMLINLNKYDYLLKSQNVDKELLLYKYIIKNCE